eukprot:INCI3293.2.p1 GENE.INCI3293.2~~INCI3293.2.p1  ORF type:complete len:910 (+),score=165.66 INCI3293.2:122-2851(+)
MSSELPTLLQGEVLKQGASALKFFHPRYIVLKNDGTLWSFKSRNDFTAWKGAKQLLRLEHKRGTVGRVPGSPTDFFVARGKKKEFFREANLAKVNEWLDAAQHIIDPSETPAVVTPRASAGSSARDSDGGPNFAGGGAKGSTSPFDQSDDEDAEDGERSRSGSNDGMSPKDDSYQTASELSNAAVDTTGLFDIHFPVSSMGRKWPPLRQRNVNLQDLKDSIRSRVSVLKLQHDILVDVFHQLRASLRTGTVPVIIADRQARNLLHRSFKLVGDDFGRLPELDNEFLSSSGSFIDWHKHPHMNSRGEALDELDEVFLRQVEILCLENSEHRAMRAKSDFMRGKSAIYMFSPSSDIYYDTQGQCCGNSRKLTNTRNALAVAEMIPIRQVLEDFSGESLPERAYILMLNAISEPNLKILSQHQTLRKVLRSNPVNVFCDFVALESQAVNLELPRFLSCLWSPGENMQRHLDMLTKLAVRKLVALCAATNEYPIVQFMNRSAPSCAKLAAEFTLAMDKFVGDHPDFSFHGTENVNERSRILFIDRSIDFLEPVLHHPSLQSCLYKYRCPSRHHEYNMHLSDKSSLWVTYRHEKIWTVLGQLTKRLQFLNSVPKKNEMIQQKMEDMASLLQVCTDIAQEIHEDGFDHEVACSRLQGIIATEQTIQQAIKYVKLGDARLLSFDEIVADFESACIGQDANTRADLLLVLLLVHNDMPEKMKNAIREYCALPRQILARVDKICETMKYLPQSCVRKLKTRSEQIEFSLRAMRKHESLVDSIEREGTQLLTVVERFLCDADEGKSDDFPFIKQENAYVLKLEAERRARETAEQKAASRESFSSKASQLVSDAFSKKSIQLNLVTDITSSIDPKAGNAIRASGSRVFVVLLGGASVSELQSLYALTRNRHQQVWVGITF